MSTKTTTTAPWGRIPPALDLRKLFEKLDLPDVGQRFLETRRKDIEALVDANRQAYRALETLGKRQQEILRAAIEAWQEGARAVIAEPKLRDKASRSLRHSQDAFGRAVADLRELAEMAVASNRNVLGVLDRRLQERLSEAGVKLPKAKVVAEPVPDEAPAARRTAAPRRTRRAAS